MSIWKKAVSTLATAGLLASLLGTAVAGTASAANAYPILLQPNSATVAYAPGSYAVFTPKDNTSGQFAFSISGGSFAFADGKFQIVTQAGGLQVGSVLFPTGWVAVTDGTVASGHIWVTASGTGTATITEWQANGSLGFTATGNTYTATFISAAQTAISATNSVVQLTGTAGTCTLNASGTGFTEAAVTSADYKASPAGTLCVYVANGADLAVTDASVTAVITPVGVFSTGLQAVQLTATATPGVFSASFKGSAIAGVATISVTATRSATGSVALAPQKFTFTGPVASITAAVKQLVGNKTGSPTFAAVKFTAKDAAGNLVQTSGATAASAGSSVFASLTVAQFTDTSTPTPGTVTVACSAEGSDTITVSQTVGSTTVKSNAVKIYCSGAPTTVALSFDKKTVAPGGTATLTLTATDSAGQPAYLAANATAVVSAGAVLDSNATPNNDGTFSWSYLAPFNTGVATAAVSFGTFDTQYASINVSVPVPVAAATNASALGKTLTGPFTTATKVAAKGAYVTFKMSFGSADAGKTITIYKAAKTASGTWGSWAVLTTRTANANGDVFVYVVSGGAWLSIRGTDGTVWTPAVQARWQ